MALKEKKRLWEEAQKKSASSVSSPANFTVSPVNLGSLSPTNPSPNVLSAFAWPQPQLGNAPAPTLGSLRAASVSSNQSANSLTSSPQLPPAQPYSYYTYYMSNGQSPPGADNGTADAGSGISVAKPSQLTENKELLDKNVVEEEYDEEEEDEEEEEDFDEDYEELIGELGSMVDTYRSELPVDAVEADDVWGLISFMIERVFFALLLTFVVVVDFLIVQ